MPQRPDPPPMPPPPVCVAHNIASHGECPACERELRNAKRFALTMLVLMVGFVAAFVVRALG
jgi:hypothetical protein